MGNNNFMKIFAIFAWLVFAAVSCWATAESLFLSFSGGAAFPRWVFWVIVIGFYVLTSLGTKWIVEGVSENYSENKVGKLVGGLIIVILFWFVISMPTNAHTFLYKKAAKSVAQKECTYLDKELSSITNVDAYALKLRGELEDALQKVEQSKAALKSEIRNEWRKGVGGKAETYIQDIENTLGVRVGTIPRIQNRNTSDAEINRCTTYYDNAIQDQVDAYTRRFEERITPLIEEYEKNAKDAKDAKVQLSAVSLALNDTNVSQEDVLAEARKQINNAYNILDKHNVGSTESARNKYIEVEKNMPSNRLTNVVEVVWKDYLHGDLNKKYDMPELKGMIYYILLSILVDLAAFLFFNIGFKKDEY